MIYRKEHVCGQNENLLETQKKQSYIKGIFFQQTNHLIYQHLGLFVENIHKPLERKARNIIDFTLKVNKSHYFGRTSFVKRNPVKSTSVDWE